MKTTEKRELDAWIAFNVTKETSELITIRTPDISFIPHYTTDPAAAMEVLKKCVQRCELQTGFNDENNCYYMTTHHDGKLVDVEAATFEIAICRAAKELFTK